MTPLVRHIILALMAAAALVWAAVAPARADGVISADEAYVVSRSGRDVCVVLDRLGARAGVAAMGATIMGAGVAQDSAADIINASVLAYCPGHWGELVAIGDAARGAHTGPLV